MNRIIIAATSILLAFVSTPAAAQDFKGDCKGYSDPASCQGSGWCTWRQPKPVTLPTGQTFEQKGSCVFRKGFKAAYQASASK